ncbi:hypothetical protein BJ095_102217 [Ureibacillus chungkukjangi]|uniref:Uncharacterized protein n=1 Tax=Ureibacillus chungkukjangi TaxID=1202712 RepID=A0A318TUA1_9BACL|nr:hypothetical protein BJ095_102217 [Ureibacillus chungkukjangi]
MLLMIRLPMMMVLDMRIELKESRLKDEEEEE